jgi:hypothetical protein
MANSFVRYTGNGSTTAFTIPFTYIDSAHLSQNKIIKNVADPVNNTDAVNKQFISTNLPNITTVAGISSDVTDSCRNIF